MKQKRGQSTGRMTNPATILIREQEAKALELRKHGLTFEQIARKTGFNSKQSAHLAVKRAIAAVTSEPAREALALDLERLDALWVNAYAKGCAGDLQSVAACMRLMDHRAKLLGLYAPVKADTKTDVTSTEVRVIYQTEGTNA